MQIFEISKWILRFWVEANKKINFCNISNDILFAFFSPKLRTNMNADKSFMARITIMTSKEFVGEHKGGNNVNYKCGLEEKREWKEKFWRVL